MVGYLRINACMDEEIKDVLVESLVLRIAELEKEMKKKFYPLKDWINFETGELISEDDKEKSKELQKYQNEISLYKKSLSVVEKTETCGD